MSFLYHTSVNSIGVRERCVASLNGKSPCPHAHLFPLVFGSVVVPDFCWTALLMPECSLEGNPGQNEAVACFSRFHKQQETQNRDKCFREPCSKVWPQGTSNLSLWGLYKWVYWKRDSHLAGYAKHYTASANYNIL